MNVCIVGYNGFLGRTVYEHLLKDSQFDNIIGIGSQSPDCLSFFDVVINCAGISSRFYVLNHYNKACLAEEKISERIKKMNFDRLIHISSMDVELEPSCYYGQMKILFEDIYMWLVQPSSRLVTLRLGSLIGKGLKKNVVFDLLNDETIYITSDSICNFISTYEVAKIISFVIMKKSLSGIINVAAKDSITFKEICCILGKYPNQFGSRRDRYIIKTDKLRTFFETKPSSYYVEEIKYLYEKEKTK